MSTSSSPSNVLFTSTISYSYDLQQISSNSNSDSRLNPLFSNSMFLQQGQYKNDDELNAIIGNLGFYPKSLEDTLEIGTKIIRIFQAVYPEKKLSGTLAEQCEEASNSFEDLPSKLYLDSLFPIRAPGNEVSGEAQRERYKDGVNEKWDFQNSWIPIPSQPTEKWKEEQIKLHFQSGFPIYLRLAHKEDKFYRYHDIDDAILPSRVNEDPNHSYNPEKAQESLFKYRYSMLPRKVRFSDETEKRIADIQNAKHISEFEALFQLACKEYNNKFSLKKAARLIFAELLSLHCNCSTHCTPFKGMVGGTIDDPLFIKEMQAIISGFRESDKVLIILDKYGRFLYNDFNSDQKREFLALGGVLQSEIVLEMDVSQFDAFIKSVM